MFDHLCEVNAVSHNPVRGVKRPKADKNEGKTPALGDGQARAPLEAPPSDTLKGKRNRAILATFLHHGLRCEELCGLRVRDLQSRQGVPHLRIFGKGSKVRYVPAHPLARKTHELDSKAASLWCKFLVCNKLNLQKGRRFDDRL